MTAVLVLRRGGLGDTLLMLPVVAALRAANPDAQIHFAGMREFVDVLAAFGAIDRALSSEDLQLWALSGQGERSTAARARWSCYSHVVADDAAVQVLAGERVRVQVFDPRPAGAGLPLARQLLRQLALHADVATGLVVTRTPPALAAPIVLAPGGGSASKCWPRARWLALAAQLAAEGAALAVVAGPTEHERDDPTRWPWPAGSRWLTGLSAVELARAMQSARALCGNDSGVTHLAAVLQVPTVAIFGPTDPVVWAPQGAHVRVVGAPSKGPPDASIAAVRAALGAC